MLEGVDAIMGGGWLPRGADDRQANAEPDAQVCPGVGRDVFKELSDLDMEVSYAVYRRLGKSVH